MKDFELQMRVFGGNYAVNKKINKPSNFPSSMELIEVNLDESVSVEMVLVKKYQLSYISELGGTILSISSTGPSLSRAFPDYISAYLSITTRSVAHVYIKKSELKKILNWAIEAIK